MPRPSKYNEDMLTLANAYIDQYQEYGDAVPMAAGMACELGVNKTTLYEWAKHHPEFSNTLDRMNQMQERLLATGALNGDKNAAIAKLMLHNHGYSDRSEVENKGKLEIQTLGVKTDFGDP